MIKSDLQLKADITAELVWDPAVNATSVGVAVRDGIATLSGTVDTYAQKNAVERAVRRVAGLRGLAVDLEVRLTPDHKRSDTEIAQAALHALRWHSLVPNDKVHVEVDDGWVTLGGEVDWAYQSASAEQCIHPLVGVRGITNNVRLKQRVHPERLHEDITAAFARHAQREAQHIRVDVDGGVVTLTGTVGSIQEHEAAIGTAFAARGVTRVIDRLQIA